MLARFPDPNDKARLVRSVFLTGGPARLPGLHERLQATLRPILPLEMELRVVGAADRSRAGEVGSVSVITGSSGTVHTERSPTLSIILTLSGLEGVADAVALPALIVLTRVWV